MKKYFPWRFFWKLTATVFSIVLVFLTIFLFLSQTQGIFNNHTLIFEFFVMVVLSFLASMIVAYRFAIPMKKIFLKAMRLANKRLFFQMNGSDFDKDPIFKLENQDFRELEQYLEQIKIKLKQRSEQMAHGYEESKTLMSGIEDAVVSVDKEGKILFFNSAFASKFVPRHVLNENPETKVFLSQIFNDDEVVQIFHRAAMSGKSENIQKSLNTNMDSPERIFSLSVSPLKDKKTHEIFEVMGIFHDISEIRWAEQVRTEFVENASHELRSPLTAVIGYLDIIKDDVESGQSQNILENLTIVNKSVSRLSALVDDLLTLSKLEHGPRLNYELIDPQLITDEVIQKLTPLAKKKNIKLSWTNHGLKNVYLDVVKLEQILSNLIGNAIKYNRESGQVEVHWSYNPSGRGYRLMIKDDGPGIDKAYQSRLFERFYRVDRARSREVGGTGLGLAIVKHIMNIHGGSISVKSDIGQGAEFICDFPERQF